MLTSLQSPWMLESSRSHVDYPDVALELLQHEVYPPACDGELEPIRAPACIAKGGQPARRAALRWHRPDFRIAGLVCNLEIDRSAVIAPRALQRTRPARTR